MVVAEGREEAGAGRERSSERRWRWRAAEWLLLRASEREGESASKGARLAAGTEADAVGRSWWPTRARLSRRMLATRWPSSAGSPRRHSTAVRARTRCGRERGEGGGRGAGIPGWLRWLGRLVGAGPPVNSPLSLFLILFFPKSLNEIFEAFTNLFRGWSKKRKCSPQNSLQLCVKLKSQIPNRI